MAERAKTVIAHFCSGILELWRTDQKIGTAMLLFAHYKLVALCNLHVGTSRQLDGGTCKFSLHSVKTGHLRSGALSAGA